MTENGAPKPKFTRRGVILGAAGLALVLVVAGVGLGVFGGNSPASFRVRFVEFEESVDKSSFLAVFCLTNETETTNDFVLHEGHNGSRIVLGRFHSQADTDEDWLGQMDGEFSENRLMPHAAREAKVPLPNDGRTGRVEVCLATVRLMPTGPLGRFREWWRSKVPLREKTPRVICDQVIQCPRVLPDGTVESPRLVRDPERKR